MSLDNKDEINYHIEQITTYHWSKRTLQEKTKNKEYQRLGEETKNKLINKVNESKKGSFRTSYDL